MTNFFRASSQTSPLQQAIEKATDPTQDSEDWSLIMNICDHVSKKDEIAKEAMKIIRKRLQIHPSGSGLRVISLTLTLLEALAKNCGKTFHLQIAHREFLKEFKNIIGPKNNPSVQLQQRVLTMIQSWALAFRNDPDLKQVEHFYQECKQQGLEFPPPEAAHIIQTATSTTANVERSSLPSRSTSQTVSAKGQHRSTRTGSDSSVYQNQSMPPTKSLTMPVEQLAKLRSELDVVQTNVQVFGEMLLTLQPGDENPQDFELLMELHRTCQQMQSRIVELLSQISIDEITVDLLRYNDSFNHSFKLFENYMKERDRNFRNSPLYNRSALTSNLSSRPADNEPALIRFDDELSSLTNHFQTMPISPSVVPKPVASSRSMNVQSPTALTRSMMNNQDPERDVREVEQWLQFQGDTTEQDDSSRRDDGTTAAFNNFLEKRASTIPAEATSERNLYQNMQPVTNRIDLNEK